jgi:hypothetical protein
MKRSLLIAVLIFPIATFIYWIFQGAIFVHKMPAEPANKSVEERLQQYGPAARERLEPYFEAKQITYPPARLAWAGFKDEKSLEVYAAPPGGKFQFVRAYPILAASGVPGPKLREGDKQVPEGVYAIESLNPNSRYHLSLRVGYPNVFDLDKAQADGRANPGGDIMIHGSAVSIGCLAVGDEASEDLFVLAADTGLTNITVVLSPADFRKGKPLPLADALPVWTESLYKIIAAKLAELPAANPP